MLEQNEERASLPGGALTLQEMEQQFQIQTPRRRRKMATMS